MLEGLQIEHITIDGTNYELTAGTSDVNSGAISMANVFEALIEVTVGTMAASSTVDAKLQGSADGSTGWTDIAGSAATQFTATDDNKKYTWHVKEPTYAYLRVAFVRGDGGNSAILDLTVHKKGRQYPVTLGLTAGQHIAARKSVLGTIAGTA